MCGDERSPDLCGQCSGADAPRRPGSLPAPGGVDTAAGTSPLESDASSGAPRSSAGDRRPGVPLSSCPALRFAISSDSKLDQVD